MCLTEGWWLSVPISFPSPLSPDLLKFSGPDQNGPVPDPQPWHQHFGLIFCIFYIDQNSSSTVFFRLIDTVIVREGGREKGRTEHYLCSPSLPLTEESLYVVRGKDREKIIIRYPCSPSPPCSCTVIVRGEREGQRRDH